MHIQRQEITLNINYSTPYQPLVQFREKYDKQKTYMSFKFTAISIKILNKKPNMEYIDKKRKKKEEEVHVCIYNKKKLP